MHWAVDAGAIKNVRYLLERGANTNIQNNKGKTPLLLAREKKWHAIADLLIEEQLTRTSLENFCLKRDKTLNDYHAMSLDEKLEFIFNGVDFQYETTEDEFIVQKEAFTCTPELLTHKTNENSFPVQYDAIYRSAQTINLC